MDQLDRVQLVRWRARRGGSRRRAWGRSRWPFDFEWRNVVGSFSVRNPTCRHDLQAFGPQDERQVFCVAVDVEVAAEPAFLLEVDEAFHFDALGVVGVAFDFELARLREVFGRRFEFEVVLADSQGERDGAVDVEVAAELGGAGEV